MFELDTLIVGLAMAALGGLLVFITAKYYEKKYLNSDFLLEKIDEITSEILQDENMQKKIYCIGALIGNGVKSGVGFSGKGGKMKFEDLIIGVASNFLSGGGGGGNPLAALMGQGQQQPAQQQTKKEGTGLVGVLG